MKLYSKTLLPLFPLLLGLSCGRQHSDSSSAVRRAGARTFSSFDRPAAGGTLKAAQSIKLEQAELSQVLGLYAEVSGRSVILGGDLPEAKFTFCNQTAMSTVEVLQSLDTVLAGQGVTMVLLGTQYVKAVPVKMAASEPGPIPDLDPEQLPDSDSFVVYIVRLKKTNMDRVLPALMPFSKIPNSIVALGSGNSSRPSTAANLPNVSSLLGVKEHPILILRDYSSNVRRMLRVLEELDR